MKKGEDGLGWRLAYLRPALIEMALGALAQAQWRRTNPAIAGGIVDGDKRHHAAGHYPFRKAAGNPANLRL